MSKPVRTPTIKDYQSFNGAHCAYIWHTLAEGWHCPGCNRTKFEVMRWTVRHERHHPKAGRYEAWLAAFHTHHDHRADHGLSPRFAPAVVCDHCNAVDAAVRRKCPSVPGWFSFSPAEIRQIITARPHQGHLINYDIALGIWMDYRSRKPITQHAHHASPA